MSDVQDDDFNKEMAAAFETDENVVENPVVTPPTGDPATPPEPPKAEEEPKKDDEPANPANTDKKDEEPETPPADPAKPTEGEPTPSQAPETPPAPAESQPLTEDGIRRIMGDIRREEHTSNTVLRNTYNEVMEAYYPDGLSNVLVDQSSGKELRTPQDVVDASGGDMSIEEAAKWLMNEQYKLDQNIANIQRQAAQITENTVNFKRDSMAVLQKYEPLFKAYPQLQEKAYNLMIKQVKADPEKGVILSAPDVMELYDTYLEPYQQAYEFSTHQPATNPTPPATPPPATPGQADRMDEGGGDGGASPVDDPNDFAQQVNKELAKGF